MKKTRKLSELYRIAYGRIMDAKDEDYSGLCHLVNTLGWDGLITWEEKELLLKDLKKNRPGEWKHPDFAICHEYDDCALFWWPRGQLAHRKAFLLEMIEYSKPWYIKLYKLWTQPKLTEKTSPDT